MPDHGHGSYQHAEPPPAWRVLFRVRGGDEEWHSCDGAVDAWESAYGLLSEDRYHLLDRLRIEVAIRGEWVDRYDLLDRPGGRG